MHWSESNLPVSMQGKSKELKNIYITAANKSFSKFQDEQAAAFAASQAVGIEERRLLSLTKKAVAPSMPLHLKAVLDASKPSLKPINKQGAIQQAFLPDNALKAGTDRSLVSADFDSNGRLVLLFDTGEKITTSEIAIKEYIEQNIAIAPNTQILSTDGSITVDQENQVFDLGTAAVINPLDHLDFNLASTSAGAVGRLKYNATDGTLEFGMRGGNVTQQIGQELPIPVKHADNAGLINGRVVYQAGSNGDNILVRYAQANTENTSAKVFGLLTEDSNGGAPAFCTTFGIVRDIDTSTLTEGESVWLSPTSPGGLTTTKPSAPNHLVFVGLCIRSHATQGKIFVNTQNGYELEELHNVSITNLLDGQVLTYESASGLWKNKTISNASVISVGLSLPTGLSVTGSPITTSGTFAVTYTSGYSIPTTANQTNWSTAYTQRLQWDGGSTNLNATTARTSLGLGTAATKDLGVANGVASLDNSGLIPSSQLPAIAITDTHVVSSDAAMLALTAEIGDVAVRLDLNKSFILKASPSTTLANWQELLTPTDIVTSVAGRTGAVTLYSTDISGLGTAATTDSSAYATAAQGTKADTAYSWGNHALAGYLTSFTETDPVFQASPSASITNTDITNWNNAAKTVNYFNKIDTVANTAFVVNHNLGLVDKDAFTINTMLAGSQVQASVSSVDVNSITITTSVATTNLAVTIVGVKL